MQTLSNSLKKRLLDVADSGHEPVIDRLHERPVFFLAPLSMLGGIWGGPIAASAKGLIAAVDDVSTAATIHGVPRWTTAEFMERAKRYPDAVAIDFSCSQFARAMIAKLCDEVDIERRDCVVAQAQLGLAAVYESAGTYRRRTLERLDDFLKVADRLDDDLSRTTLFANLLFRLTYDRDHLLQAWSNPQDEYFSGFASNTATFQLGRREHYCDCGASKGPIVRKFIAASAGRYESITAFEPDRINFRDLERITSPLVPNFRPVNKAVSNQHQSLHFMETGTVSSHVSEQGTIEVKTTRLDDELEHLTLLKMDVEGFETQTLEGASRLLRSQRPRVAACVYHYAHDLLRVLDQFDRNVEDYHFRLRQHYGSYYYDLVLYASPEPGVNPSKWAE